MNELQVIRSTTVATVDGLQTIDWFGDGSVITTLETEVHPELSVEELPKASTAPADGTVLVTVRVLSSEVGAIRGTVPVRTYR